MPPVCCALAGTVEQLRRTTAGSARQTYAAAPTRAARWRAEAEGPRDAGPRRRVRRLRQPQAVGPGRRAAGRRAGLPAHAALLRAGRQGGRGGGDGRRAARGRLAAPGARARTRRWRRAAPARRGWCAGWVPAKPQRPGDGSVWALEGAAQADMPCRDMEQWSCGAAVFEYQSRMRCMHCHRHRLLLERAGRDKVQRIMLGSRGESGGQSEITGLGFRGTRQELAVLGRACMELRCRRLGGLVAVLAPSMHAASLLVLVP